MKLKYKHKSLFLALLIANPSTISNASNMSYDNRYEIFDSSDLIEINELLEPQTVDLEIEGNTLLNIIDYDKATIPGNNTWVATHENSGGKILLSQTSDNFIRFDYDVLKPIEVNKEYTLFIDITKNTMVATNDSYKNVGKVVLSKDGGDDNVIGIKPGQQGYIKYLYKPNEVVRKPYISTNPYALGELEFRDFMIVEGNHLDKSPAFFRGIMSSGENNLNILTYNRDLILDNDNIKSININGLSKISEDLKDRIIKINGLWHLEKKLGIMEFDGSSDEVWESSAHNSNITNGNYIYYFNETNNQMEYPPKVEGAVLCDKLKTKPEEKITPTVGISTGTLYNEFRIVIPTSTDDVSLCQEYLRNNPIKVVYELDTPIYEPLNIDLSVELFSGKTYIGTDSVVPATMKFTVDRTINRAVEALNVAQNSSTTYNISQARYWCNLLKESSSKDYITNKLNEILNIDDIKLAKETLSATSDIYIKGKSTLSLSLNTNNIIFDEFDGVDKLEIKDAINLSISSSLPYSVNATLESEIYNKDKTSTIDSSVLSIKPSANNSYQSFVSPGIPMNLFDNQSSGTNINHKIDIALNSTNILKTDCYKTAIKFEVQQQ